MKTVPLAMLVVAAGLVAGSGASFATGLILSGQIETGHAPAPAPDPLPTFVPSGKIMLPLVFPTGRLAGYVSIEVQLEVASDEAKFVTARLPFLLNAINMKSFRTPMTSGPDGMLPDLSAVRAVVIAAAIEAFGPGIVRRVAIVQAVPA